MGLRPKVLKCMSATAGSGRVRAAATAAAVVLKRTAPECLAAAAATLTRRWRGPAAPARGRLGRGGRRRQPHRRPALLAAVGLGPEPAARAGTSTLRTAASPPSPSARRLSGHPRSPLCREKARQPRGLGGRQRERTPSLLALLSYCSWPSDAPRSPNHSALPIRLSCRLNPLPSPAPTDPLHSLWRNAPSSQGSSGSTLRSKPSRRLSYPPSELIRNLLLMEPPPSTLIAMEPPPQTESTASPTLSLT